MTTSSMALTERKTLATAGTAQLENRGDEEAVHREAGGRNAGFGKQVYGEQT